MNVFALSEGLRGIGVDCEGREEGEVRGGEGRFDGVG